MPRRTFFINESEADDYQVVVIGRRINQSSVVKGCAGSGKSILALWKTKQIQEDSQGSYFFILYTLSLKQFMKDGIDSLNLNNEQVIHFEEWRRRGYPSADYIIVDEAQDFSKDAIELFKCKSNIATWLFGDSVQQVYGWRKPPPLKMEEIITLTDYQDEKLVFNHRLPKKIARLAEKIVDIFELESACRNEGTELPKILQYRSYEEQMSAIMEIIEARNFEDVGILFRTNREVERTFNFYNSKGVLVEAKYERDAQIFNNLDFRTNNPKITTYHSAKGLQFEAVFLPNCTYTPDDRNPLYVAITRSYQSLYIFYTGALNPVFGAIPSDLYDTDIAGTRGERL